jgi:hypothetical protein
MNLCGCRGIDDPPPPIYTQYIKEQGSATEEEVKQAMRLCGYIDLYGYGMERNVAINERAKRQNCMFLKGFKFKDGYKGICGELAADIRANRSYPYMNELSACQPTGVPAGNTEVRQ